MVQGKDCVSRAEGNLLSTGQRNSGSDLPTNCNGSRLVTRLSSEAARSKSANNRFDTRKPSADVEVYTLLRQMAARLARAKGMTSKDYHVLVTEADRELARLLRDIRSHPQSVLLDKRQYSPMNELLMRAIYCVAQQYVSSSKAHAALVVSNYVGRDTRACSGSLLIP
jgi:hypothetical protein